VGKLGPSRLEAGHESPGDQRCLVGLPGWFGAEVLYVHDASSPSVLPPPVKPPEVGTTWRMAQQQRWASLGSRATGGRLEETRGAERSEHHSALEARGDRRYLRAPEDGIRGSWRLVIPHRRNG